MIRLTSAEQAKALEGQIPALVIRRMEQFQGTDGTYDPQRHGHIVFVGPAEDITTLEEISEAGLLPILDAENPGYEFLEAFEENGQTVYEMAVALDDERTVAVFFTDCPALDRRLADFLDQLAPQNRKGRTMTIDKKAFPLPLSDHLVIILQDELAKVDLPPGSGAILTFKDPGYSPETGGYHPVEVYVTADGKIQYITDFSFVGRPPYSELAKELDFDASLGLFQHLGRELPIQDGRELFGLWQSNFISYYQMGVYTVAVEDA